MTISLFCFACKPHLVDQDGDGYDSTIDCDDQNREIHPYSDEVCNGIDDNCNGKVDDTDPGISPALLTKYFLDEDNDGYGSQQTILLCEIKNGYAEITGDCDDNNSNTNPGMHEICDGIDNDCDALTNENNMATRITNNSIIDETDNILSGNIISPYTLNITQDSELHFCKGVHNLNIHALSDLTIYGHEEAVLSTFYAETLPVIYSEDVNIEIHNIEISDGNPLISVAGGTALLENTRLNNSAFISSMGIYAENTHLTISNSIYDGGYNEEDVSGIYVLESQLQIKNSIFNNLHSGFSSVFGIVSSTLSISDNTQFYDNDSALGTIYALNSMVTCEGSTEDSTGIFNNTSDWVSGVHLNNSELSSIQCDFGETNDLDESEAVDIAIIDGSEYRVGNNSDFECSNLRCGESTTHTFGLNSSNVNIGGLVGYECQTGESLILGNIFIIEGTPTLESFSFQNEGFDSNNSICAELNQELKVTPALFKWSENEQWGPNWELIWSNEDMDSNNGADIGSSGDIGISFEDGDKIAVVLIGHLLDVYINLPSQDEETNISGFGRWEGDSIFGNHVLYDLDSITSGELYGQNLSFMVELDFTNLD